MSILDTSVSGMLANSNWLSNISQNVANANSTGYKTADTPAFDTINSSFAANAAQSATIARNITRIFERSPNVSPMARSRSALRRRRS